MNRGTAASQTFPADDGDLEWRFTVTFGAEQHHLVDPARVL